MPHSLAVGVAVILLTAGFAPTDRLEGLVAEFRHSDHAHSDCLDEDVLSGSDAVDIVAHYQRTRGLAEPAARAVLANLLEYVLRPTPASFAALRKVHLEAGAAVPVAEDICECVYFGEEQGRASVLAAVTPPFVGHFWAGRVLHERGHPMEALDHYRRSLEGSPADPRTRLFYAIDLIDVQRPAEALGVLAPIAPDWAPAPVAYWRARALLDTAHPSEARRLLEPIAEGWKEQPTRPRMSMTAGPVQAPRPPRCVIAEAKRQEGDAVGAREDFEKYRCSPELASLDLREDRPFDALLEIESAFGQDPSILQALSRVGACEWARGDLPRWRERCAGEYAPRECPLLPKAEAEVLAACPAEASPPEGAIDPALAARLARPRLTPFEERPVPADKRWTGVRSDQAPSVEAYPALAERAIVAVSPRARRMFAVSVSEDLDPRGEVSAGGYWLHLSSDEGRSWDGPYYLGFAHQFPYVILSETHMPAFDGDRINIEVERREVDESTITFPPVGLQAKSYEKDLYLSVDLAAVERDSDGDGLTDLFEEKLALDPLSADTDGDGIPDAADPLPLQPHLVEESSERERLLAVVLPYLFDGPPPIQQGAAGPGESSTMSFGSRTLAAARTLFVSGSSGVLPHAAGIRAILLPPTMLALYTKKFGTTYPMDLPDIAFDRDHRRALVRYDFQWRGGSLLAERKGDNWVITPRGNWIT